MSLFAELGLRRYLNAEDTFTTNGASCMPPEVYRAMEEISGAWVDLEQMQRRVGEALAQCTRNEGAYVSAGAASALTLCAAAAICQGDLEAFLALPDASRCQRNELLVLSPQRNAYSLSLAASGARLRWAGQAGAPLTLAELEGAFTPRTAAVCYFVFHGAALCPPLESILAAAHARDIPVFVDAAAQLPPAENLWRSRKWARIWLSSAAARDWPAPRTAAWWWASGCGPSVCWRWAPPTRASAGDRR